MNPKELIGQASAYLINRGEKSPEIPPPPYILVYGNVLGGAGILSSGLQRFLEEKGIKAVVKHVTNAALIEESFYNKDANVPSSKPDSLPLGVIIFPHMRQLDPQGMGMTIDTYDGHGGLSASDIITQLCEKHEVPVVKFYGSYAKEQLQEGLNNLFPSKPNSQ